MPYFTEVIEPDIVLEHEGVTVYHTYTNDEWTDGPQTYWFTTDPNDLHEENHFDVRVLPVPARQTVLDAPLSKVDEPIRKALRQAIEAGLLKPEQPAWLAQLSWNPCRN